jgi:hydroxyacylglutathione hydrolase
MNSEKTDGPQIRIFAVGPLQTNCYLVYDPTSMAGAVVDPGWHDERMLREINEIGVKVNFVINTHGHADHMAGNDDFTAPVIIHRMDEELLSDPVKNLSCFSGSPVTSRKAGRVVEDGDAVNVGGFELSVMHTPGHTPGGISLKCEDSVFSGDTLFFEGIGRTDLPGGDLEEILESIDEKLMCLPDHIKVFPGHGPETTIGDARSFMKKEFPFRIWCR